MPAAAHARVSTRAGVPTHVSARPCVAATAAPAAPSPGLRELRADHQRQSQHNCNQPFHSRLTAKNLHA
jgi:hypothetical protein